MEIFKRLEKFAEKNYKNFNLKIIPTKQKVLWVRIPDLRKIAKEIAKDEPYKFIKLDKQNIYELVMLEWMVLSYMNESFANLLPLIETFLDKVDNWAQIDSTMWNFKNMDKELDLVLQTAKKWIKSEKEFIARAWLIVLLSKFVKKDTLDTVFQLSEEVENKAYYVHMANAWLISVCMAKFPNETKIFFQNNKLDKVTHNKAIQKSIESFRVSDEDKEFLRGLKRWKNTWQNNINNYK